jgi:hypothetical protein
VLLQPKNLCFSGTLCEPTNIPSKVEVVMIDLINYIFAAVFIQLQTL